MKQIPIKSILFFFAIALLLPHNEAKAGVSPEYIDRKIREKYARIGEEVAMYAYPLVMMDTLCKQQTYTNAPTQNKAPINQFAHEKRQATPLDLGLFPNIDCLASSAWINISREPQIIHFPPLLKRHFFFEIFDAWTNVIATINPTILGDEAADFMIVPPDYKAKIPQGVTVIKSNSSLVNIRGFIQCFGPDDYEQIAVIQNAMQIVPLRQYGDDYSPPALVPYPPLAATKERASDQLASMFSREFFDTFGDLVLDNPPPPQDVAMLKPMRAIGIKGKNDYDVEAINPLIEAGLAMAWHNTRNYIEDSFGSVVSERGHWTTVIRTEKDFGTDYVRRSLLARAHLPCPLSQNLLAFQIDVDSRGMRLHGRATYKIRIPNMDKLAKLWSLTLYTEEATLCQNPINAYAIQSFATSLKKNADGSCDIYMQRYPRDLPTYNWLPCPFGNYSLILRLYEPREEALYWNPPEIKLFLTRDCVE